MTTSPSAPFTADRPLHASPVPVDASHPLGPYLRQVRKDQGLRIDDAASLFGVSVDLLSRAENGKGTVRLDKLLAILDGLGLAMMVGPKAHMLRITEGLESAADGSA